MSIKNAFFKCIYQPTFNHFLRNVSFPIAKRLDEKFQIPPSGKISFKINGNPVYLATNQTSYLTKILFWEGANAFEYTSIFLKLMEKATVFMDIGSNIGYYAILAATINKNTVTYAFEPAKGPSYYLNQNIKLNNLENQIIQCDTALSDKEGTLDFYEVSNNKYPWIKYNLSGEHNAGTKTKGRNYIKTTVQSTTLDAFVAYKDIPPIDLIKIDTEGTEVDILKKGLTTIKRDEPIIICETLYNTIETDLENFFNDLPYDFFNVVEDQLVKVDSINRNTDDGVRNCFFVPHSKLEWISPFCNL